MVAVVVPGTVAVGALEGMAAVVVPGRIAAVVAALAGPGAPAELSMPSFPSLPAALPVVGGSTGCDFPETLLIGVGGTPRSTTPPERVEDAGAAHGSPATVAGFPFTTATPSREIEARNGPFSVRNWRVW